MNRRPTVNTLPKTLELKFAFNGFVAIFQRWQRANKSLVVFKVNKQRAKLGYFSSSSLILQRRNPPSVLSLFMLLLLLLSFFFLYIVNYYFQVSFNLKVILCVAKMMQNRVQNTVSEFLGLPLLIDRFFT